MLILIAILAVALFICFFKDNVKKYSKFYYIGAILVTLLIFFTTLCKSAIICQ